MATPPDQSGAPGGPITVAVVEDHAAVRQSLAAILDSDRDLRCVAACGSGEEALEVLPPLRPNVVLMDINLPGMSGVECVVRLSRQIPETLLVMLTVHDDTEAIFNALAAGASGYLLKPVRAAELLAAVRDVQGGGSPMTSNIARKIVQTFNKPAAPQKFRPGEQDLTEREREVLGYLSQGYLYKEIAKRMKISYHTIHSHIRRIYEKLHVQSRAQAIALFLNEPPN